jgi:hypothetical protein
LLPCDKDDLALLRVEVISIVLLFPCDKDDLALLRVEVISIVLLFPCDKDDWALLRVGVISIVLYFHVIVMLINGQVTFFVFVCPSICTHLFSRV